MPRLQIKANELVQTDASFVSLVKRGANRIPFRITKEDEPMLDLHKIGRNLFKKEDPKPEIVAAIVQPGADIARVAAIFKEAGLEPKSFIKTEEDGITTVARSDYADAHDVALLKVGEDMVLAVSNMKKGFDSYAYNSTDFNAIMATEGVYPSMCVAKDVLGGTISNILYKSSSPAEAAGTVGAAIDDFKTYMVGLLGAVPVSAFKMDVAIAKAAEQKLPDDKSGAGAEEPAPKPKARKDEVPAASDEQPVTEAQNVQLIADEAGKVEKADAGKNGTGAGFEHGKGTGTDPKATADDAANTEVNSTGEPTTGNPDPQMPQGVKKEQIAGAPDPKGFEPGDADGFAAPPTDSQAATARASADDKKMKQNGGTDGSSPPRGAPGLPPLGGLRREGPAQAAEEPPPGGKQPEAQVEEPAPVAKTDLDPILAAIADLKKSLEGSVDEVRSTVSALSERVDGVAEQARKADEAINGRVFNEAGGDAVARPRKADDGAPPLLDTAYSRRAVA